MMDNDYLTNKLANLRLINAIQSFWRKRGFIVRAWTERVDAPDGGKIFVIRTNVVQDVSKIDPTYTVI